MKQESESEREKANCRDWKRKAEIRGMSSEDGRRTCQPGNIDGLWKTATNSAAQPQEEISPPNILTLSSETNFRLPMFITALEHICVPLNYQVSGNLLQQPSETNTVGHFTEASCV